jgi:hypothetical protein
MPERALEVEIDACDDLAASQDLQEGHSCLALNQRMQEQGQGQISMSNILVLVQVLWEDLQQRRLMNLQTKQMEMKNSSDDISLSLNSNIESLEKKVEGYGKVIQAMRNRIIAMQVNASR